MKKKIIRLAVIILVILIALPICAIVCGEHRASDVDHLKEGDIVFRVSDSRQSPLVALATLSPWTHCGIVVEKNNSLYVLEAVSTVKLTPIKRWMSWGKFGVYKSK